MKNGRWIFILGEYAAGVATALATALPVHALVAPGSDMVLAMLLGSAVGMVAHLVVSAVLGPLLGMFQMMASGSLAGMYGGMFFGMRDAMQQVSWMQVSETAAVVGIVVVAGVRLYDRSIRAREAPAKARPQTSALPLRRRWDRASRTYDFATGAEGRLYGPAKRRLFEGMRGRCLMLATGTGHDFRFLPPGLQLIAVDISRGMLAQARPHAAAYSGRIHLAQMDARSLAFADGAFDTVVTVCTFCSVPDPVIGLRELYRVLEPGGTLLVFEHVRSRLGPLAVMQDILTPITRRIGPDLNRDTFENLARAGFRVVREDNVYLDVVKAAEAVRG